MNAVVLEETNPTGGNQAAEWKALAEIVSQAEQLEKQIQASNYQKAYNHFANLSYQCIQCHQARRSWGVFDEPKPVEKGPQESKNGN